MNTQVPWGQAPNNRAGVAAEEYERDQHPPAPNPAVPQQTFPVPPTPAAPLRLQLRRPASPLPADAPPISAAPTDSLAVQLAIARTNGVPRKRRRTADQIRESVASATARKVQRAADKAETVRLKAAAKAAKEMLKIAEAAAVASRFTWTEEASLELLSFVKMIKDEHDELTMRQPGFTSFPKYFLLNDDRKDEYPLLAKIENDTMIRRYKVLMNLFRQVRDYADTSGSGGLFPALIEFGLPESLWDAMLGINTKNAGAAARGALELHLQDLQVLLDVSGATVPEEEADEDLPAEITDPVDGPPAAPSDPLTQEASVAPGTITPASALPNTPATSSASDVGTPPLSSAARLVPQIPATTRPATGAPQPPSTGHASVPTTPGSVGGSRPVPTITMVPCRRGRTEDNPKKEEMGNQMMMMMYKATEQSSAWQREQRVQAEETRLEDRREALARAELKEQARKDELAQAKLDAEHLRLQVQLDRDAMELRAREAERRAAQRDEDRKLERQEVMQLRMEEARRFEATQAASEKSRMAFEAAMLAVMSNLSRGGGGNS